MNLPELNANLNNIQALSDKPNTMDGLTSNELKEKFNQASQEIIYRYSTYFYTYGVVLMKLNRFNNAKIYFNKTMEIIECFLLPNDPWIININDLIKICDSKKVK